ncbi:MAG: MraY family glycosyltransferase [Elusimicrobiota bacterium]
MIENLKFYLFTFFISLAISLFAVPLMRKAALFFGLCDKPNEIKTHKGSVPVLGGAAVFFSFAVSLIIMRFYTSFPTGTLRDLRYILAGAFLILLLGIADDFRKPKGLSVGFKFFIQFLIAFFMVFSGFRIKFIYPEYLSWILSMLWIVGVSNAFNIIDIMDGLSASQAFAAALAFWFIALPSEQIYVNFLAAALSGAALGFLPYNFSSRLKIFLGDSGSLFLGFVLAILSLGDEYSKNNVLAVYAPIFILAVPIYDTFFVSFMRIKKGISPFSGSKDHYALRMEKMGFSRKKIVYISFLFSVFLGFSAWLSTVLSWHWSALIYFTVGAEFVLISKKISSVDI